MLRRSAYSTRQPRWPVRLIGAAVRTKLSVPFWYVVPGESLSEKLPLLATSVVRAQVLLTPPVSQMPGRSVSKPLLKSVA